jgi:hypothetical protein
MVEEVTGRDGWIITEALATALVALEQLHWIVNRIPIWMTSGSCAVYRFLASRPCKDQAVS